MKVVSPCIVAILLSLTAMMGSASAEEAEPLHLTVGELIAGQDKFMGKEVIVRGHLMIEDLWRAIEAVHNLYESKAVLDGLGRDWKVIADRSRRIHGPDEKSEDAAQDMLSLEHKYCITVLPVEPFRRGRTYLTDRTVTIKGHLEKYGGVQGCNLQSGIALVVDELVDPPPSNSGGR